MLNKTFISGHRKAIRSFMTGFLYVVSMALLFAHPHASWAIDAKALFKHARDSVVLVMSFDANSQPHAIGSGFFVGDGTLIVTNYHVIEGSSGVVIKQTSGDVVAIDTVAGVDFGHDLVILRSPSEGKPLKLATRTPEIGEDIIAIGNPKGLEGTLSKGIVSGLREEEGSSYYQITAPISPGSSGGPIINDKGEVLGVSTFFVKGGQNLNFAMPAAYVHRLLRVATLRPLKPPRGRLYIRVKPREASDARIRIMNIVPKFRQGIELGPGTYDLDIRKKGYETYRDEIKLEAGEDRELEITLAKLPEPEPTQTTQTVSRPQRRGTWTDPVTGTEFVWIEGGCYQMGCGSWTDNCNGDEKPVHEVCVDGFWLGKYEVTQGQWRQIMGSNPSHFKNGDNYPVEVVSWNDCKNFIQELNSRNGGNFEFRLPTEAEWEYACRSGGKPEKYSGSNDVNSVAWYDSKSGGHTHLVGQRSPNGLGLYDMSGNVYEWCEDVYDSEAYGKHSWNNPVVTGGRSGRVGRGGSWLYKPRGARCADRYSDSPDYASISLGFRLLRVAP